MHCFGEKRRRRRGDGWPLMSQVRVSRKHPKARIRGAHPVATTRLLIHTPHRCRNKSTMPTHAIPASGDHHNVRYTTPRVSLPQTTLQTPMKKREQNFQAGHHGGSKRPSNGMLELFLQQREAKKQWVDSSSNGGDSTVLAGSGLVSGGCGAPTIVRFVLSGARALASFASLCCACARSSS